ncbi:MAG TPA: protein kinase [Thermoanaerobaculia bacterium]|nr:protein kinase [Thermoanaerobaculia bacterium]
MIGDTLSHYRVLEPLGAGGMGQVFVAEDVRLGRKVALKLLSPDVAGDPARVARLQREAKTLARLQHPGIVTLFEIEEDAGRTFLVMELIRGRSLDRLIPPQGMPWTRLVELAIPVADALAVAHQAGVVHRDLKPSNVVVADDGAVKVCDFGLAALWPRDDDTQEITASLTATDAIVGTVPYLAPEQLRGARADPRSDLFSFGVMLYEMATGERPFRGGSRLEVVGEILHHEPPSLAELRPGLPADLARIVHHCLRKDPEHRYQTAKGLRNELQELVAASGSGAAAARPLPAGVRPRRRWAAPAAALALVLAAAVALAIALAPWRRDAAPRVGDPQARALVAQADRYEGRGDVRSNLAHAEQVLRRALEREPANAYLQARLAALLARIQGQYPSEERREEIERLADGALASDPTLAPGWLAQGRLALQAGSWEAAESAARQAIAADPGLIGSYGLLGEALVARGDVEGAIAEASRPLDEEPENVSARVVLGKVLLEAGRYNQAAAQYERVLELAPDSPNALNNLGMIYVWTGREIDAIPLLSKALQEQPNDAAATNLGYAYYNLGRYEEAAQAFRRAYELEPGQPSHQRNLADAYEALGDEGQMRHWLAQALREYDRVIASGGSQPRMLAERAVAAGKLGLAAEAQGDLDRALAEMPGDAIVLFHAAQVAALLGQEEILLRRVEQALGAGVPRDNFRQDLAFGSYRDAPAFRRLVFGERP